MRALARAGAVLAVAGSLAAAAAAPAAVIRTERFPAVPAFAGGEIAWVQYTSVGDAELWSAAPGAQPERVQRVRFPRAQFRSGYLIASLEASSSVALLTTTTIERRGSPNVEATSFRYHLGPPGGPLTELESCEAVPFSPPAADVSGRAYAYRVCDANAGHVEIREPGTAPVSVGRGGLRVRLAGRFVAWLEEPTDGAGRRALVVYDRIAGAEAYRVAPAEVGWLRALDLQEDGKVAFARMRDDGRDELAWASPADPTPRAFAIAPRGPYLLRIADDRIAYAALDYVGGDPAQPEVGITDLNGNATTLARPVALMPNDESFDFDGERVLWRELGCRHWRLVIRGTTARATLRGNDRLCGLRLKRPPTVRRKAATFEFDCRPFDRRCQFYVTLRHGGKTVGEAVALGNPVRVKLSRGIRRLLARGERPRVKVAATAYGEPLPWSEFTQRRRGTVRLTAAR